MTDIKNDLTDRVKNLLNEGTSIDMSTVMSLATNLLKDTTIGKAPVQANQQSEEAGVSPQGQNQMMQEISALKDQIVELKKQYEDVNAILLKITKKLGIRHVMKENND